MLACAVVPAVPPTTSACVEPELLAGYVDGALPATERAAVDHHVATCGSCRTELSLLAVNRTADPVPAPAPPRPPAANPGDGLGADLTEALEVRPGTTLGRYRVVAELGRGAMGVVVRAHDPELARDVAIKVLAPRWADGDEVRERLRREAQAMARLSHPNVVQVYDVTTDGPRLAVAMELVAGATLRDRMASAPRPDLLAICLRAGHGLAAVHRAQLVHRDFKPENVLCADDGRVLVSDFGLARLEAPGPVEDQAAPAATALAGTPAYLAPELWAGAAASATSDQFAWAVTTYEALTGARPFAGASVAELRVAVATGVVRPAPVGPGLPAPTRAALLRALSADPARRFPSMEALLAAATPRRRWWPYLAGAGVTAAALGALVVTSLDRRPGCSDRGAFAWDRAGLVSALGASPTGPRVLAALEGYEGTWRAARRDSCEATRVRGELPERVLAARLTCLDRGHRQFVELTRLVTTEPSLATTAIEAVEGLSDPRACSPEVSPATVDPRLERARTLLLAGQEVAAIELASAVLAGTPDLATTAEALTLRGQAEVSSERFEAAEATLSAAVAAAEKAHADQLVGEIWVELLQLSGSQMHRFDAAAAHQQAAEAAFARAEPGPSLRMAFASAVGATALARGDAAAARKHLEQALAADPSSRPFTRGGILGVLCTTAVQLGDLTAGRAACRQAIETLVAAVGPDHPAVVGTYNTWGALELASNDNDAALARFGAVIETLERTGVGDRTLALAYSNTGLVWTRRGDLAQARRAFARAVDLFAQHHPEHVQRTIPLQGLATIELAEGNVAAAIAAYQEASELSARAYGPDDPRTLSARYNVVLAHERSGDLDRAATLARELAVAAQRPGRETWPMVARALELEARTIEQRRPADPRVITLRQQALAALDRGDDAAVRAEVDASLGRALVAARRGAQAIGPLERATAQYRADHYPFVAATTRFALAQALWMAGGDRARAQVLAAEAAQILGALGLAGGPQVAAEARAVATWQRAHPVRATSPPGR